MLSVNADFHLFRVSQVGQAPYPECRYADASRHQINVKLMLIKISYKLHFYYECNLIECYHILIFLSVAML
jgi:hypothetical protein